MVSRYRSLIITAAAHHRVDPTLVEAVVFKESSDNPWAWRPERRYRWLWDVKLAHPFRRVSSVEAAAKAPPSDFPSLTGNPTQEWAGQQASWGLMQLMGAVGRELGYRGRYLPELCDPRVNIELGCTLLSRLLRWSQGDVEAALAAYNGGKGGNSPGGPLRNQGYADGVLAIREQITPTV